MKAKLFEHLPVLPEDPILGMALLVKKDPRPHKVDLSIGIYRDANGLSLPMHCVAEVEKKLASEVHTKVYLPIEGEPSYLDATAKLCFGENLYQQHHKRIVAAQTVGGTSALSILAHFFSQHLTKKVYVSDPTWPNHFGIFKRAGFEVASYPYYDMKKHQLKFQEMIDCLHMAKPNECVVLHGCCHNPSGLDPTMSQWQTILQIVKEKSLICIFDVAYQGFGLSLEADRQAIELFLEQGIPMAVAVSHSKNFGLYAERVGALFIVGDDEKDSAKILGNVKSLIRTDYSNPPKHGALVVSTILNDPERKKKWVAELKSYQERMHDTREQFILELKKSGLKQDFSYMRHTKGMFCFTGLTSQQVNRLMEEFAIFMPQSGRINVTGLNDRNMAYVIDSIIKVTS